MIQWRNNVIYLMLFFTSCMFESAFAQMNFSVLEDNYNCSSNLICLGDAHNVPISNNYVPSLSLTRALIGEGDGNSGGIAYYYEPVRFMDSSSGQTASFRTNFSCQQITENQSDSNIYARAGDGFTFLISADNSTSGEGGNGFFGFFGGVSGRTSFKSVAVEFDSFRQSGSPIFDANANHVSFDFMNVEWTQDNSRNADDVGIFFFLQGIVYVWVEYKAETQILDVRISNSSNRPETSFLNRTVDLSQYLEEYMWVGFSAGHGPGWSYYYMNDWFFESEGLPRLPQSKSSKIAVGTGTIIAAVISSIVGLLTSVAILLLWRRVWRRRSSTNAAHHTKWWSIGSHFRQLAGDDAMLQVVGRGEGYRFSYQELKVATRNFSEDGKLGQGGFGSVYRGVLPGSKSGSNLAIAVKKFKAESDQGEKEFKAEVSVVSQLRHRNLIQLLGWCIEKGKYHIVYELMPNGSLDRYLFGPDNKNQKVLPWQLRWSIVEGTAAAVDYLHRGWTQQVIHRDIKPSNVLLDDKWNAKLGDFGLARVAEHSHLPSTTVVAGTQGYLAPEAAITGRFTEKSDVYAFGILALEVACGRKSIAPQMDSVEIVLVDWVWRRHIEGDLLRVIDPSLMDYDEGQIEALLKIGLLCSQLDPLARPSMRTVVQVLLGDVPIPPISMDPGSGPGSQYSRSILDSLMVERSRTTSSKSSIAVSSFTESSPIVRM